jgi:AcrR family transcriptional regulator
LTGTAGSGRRTQQERTAESTQRLTEAAIALIAEQGYNSTTIAQIGERAGLSRSMVQFRYGSKAAFLEVLLREEYETRLLREPDPGESGLAGVLAQIDLLADQIDEAPGLMRGFFVLCFEAIGPLPELSGWLTGWLTRYEAATAAAIRRGVADGTIRPGVDPETEAGSLVASCVGEAFRWAALGDGVHVVARLRETRSRVEARLARPAL